MPGGKGASQGAGRFELRAEQAWLDRIARQAERLGISVSAYIRQSVTRQLERDEQDMPPPAGRRKSSR